MTPSPRPGSAPRVHFRRPLLAVGIVAVVAVAAGWFWASAPGAIGALFGVVVTTAVFMVSLWLMGRTARLAPEAVMAVALFTFTTKIFVLGLVLVLLFDATWLSGPAFAFAVIASTVVWLVVQVRTFAIRRQPVYDLEEAS